MFRSWFNTPTTIDTKFVNTEVTMTINTGNQGEKSLNIATTTTNATTTDTNTNTMTMIVSPKVSPTVKSTSVNVNMDDQNNFVNNDSIISSEVDMEPIRSASISLSIELAKKTSFSSLNSPSSSNTATSKPIFMQKPDNITPQSSLPKYITKQTQQQQQRPSSIASHSSNSLLQRMAHSPKAAPAAFSTSVSANGKNNSHQDNNDRINKSAVIESLSKQINPPAVEDLDELTEEDIHNVTTNTTTPTVSMNTTDDEDDLEDDLIENNQELQQKLDSSQSSTCENSITLQKASAVEGKRDDKIVGFWSWLGFPSSENDSKVDDNTTRGAVTMVEKNLVVKGEDVQRHGMEQRETEEASTIREESDQNNTTITTTTTTITTITTTSTPVPPSTDLDKSEQSTKTTSWSSFLFPSKTSSIHHQQPQTSANAKTLTETNTNAQAIDEAIVDDSTLDANLRKVKSTSSLPSSPLSTAQTLRYSASISSFQQPPRKKNFVFPPFESQFLENDTVDTNTISTSAASTITNMANGSSNLITKAMDAINAILIPAATPPAEEDSTSNWIAKRMRAKFSNFVEDLKQSTSTKDPVQSAMSDKRIVVVGVHGWFPMKVYL